MICYDVHRHPDLQPWQEVTRQIDTRHYITARCHLQGQPNPTNVWRVSHQLILFDLNGGWCCLIRAVLHLYILNTSSLCNEYISPFPLIELRVEYMFEYYFIMPVPNINKNQLCLWKYFCWTKWHVVCTTGAGWVWCDAASFLEMYIYICTFQLRLSW